MRSKRSVVGSSVDRLLEEMDALAERYGAQGWRLTRWHNDNAGESLQIEISLTAGEYTKWESAGRQHRFRWRWSEEKPLSLAVLLKTEHKELDEEIAIKRNRDRPAEASGEGR